MNQEFKNDTMPNPIQLEKAKVMAKAADKGCVCPVCDQFVKVYKRKINSSMAAALVNSYHHYGAKNDFTLKSVANRMGLTSTGDFAKLRHFGLIQEVPCDPMDKSRKSSGRWFITDVGRLFAIGAGYVPAYVVLYNGKKIDEADSVIGIREALNNKFDYSELMAGRV